MSKTPSEFLDRVLALVNDDTLPAIAKAAEGRSNANVSLATMLIERVVRELDGQCEAVGCLETVKFKMQIENLPERWWPKPDIQKGGE